MLSVSAPESETARYSGAFLVIPLRVVWAGDAAFEQRASLKARGYRWDDGEGKRVKAWWLMTNDPQAELDWLRADICGDDRHVTVLKAPATRRYSSRRWAE